MERHAPTMFNYLVKVRSALKNGIVESDDGAGVSSSSSSSSSSSDHHHNHHHHHHHDTVSAFPSTLVTHCQSLLRKQRSSEPKMSSLSESVPYCDFAVWGPDGRQQGKLLKFQAQVWVGGELITKMIKGPPNYG
eukprot:4990798-Amphidinium_carterae.1